MRSARTCPGLGSNPLLRTWRCSPSETACPVNAGGHGSQGPASKMACPGDTNRTCQHFVEQTQTAKGLAGLGFLQRGAWSGSNFRQDEREPDYLPTPILGNLGPHMGVCL